MGLLRHRYDMTRSFSAGHCQALFRLPHLALIVCWLSLPTSIESAAADQWLGNDRCTACHEQQAKDWQGSHHDLAMQVATVDTVLGDFNDASFNYAGITSRFFRRDDAFWVETDNANGELQTFKVEYVFGVYPLQQLLLALPGGRLQALTIAWDARPASDGGQRWYHLFPNEAIVAGDPLHWTGPYHNWNTRCAECHSTDVQKGYNRATDTFDTTFKQIDVGCEGCHGPGAKHVALAEKRALNTAKHAGFAMSLKATGQWHFKEGASIAERVEPLINQQQVDTCGRCHARRSTLGDYHYGADLLDTHQLALLEPNLYWPDGQIRDEVFVYGSFIQSKMHRAGVVCSNCHDPHSNQLTAQGNNVCGQCHKPDQFDTPKHHRHTAGSEGSQCVACHMPPQLYMGVDWRRDHSMRIPRPELTLSTGAPNACNQCHDQRSASWALEQLRGWGVEPDTDHPGTLRHRAQRNDVGVLPALGKVIRDDTRSPMMRASAIQAYAQLGAPDLASISALLLQSDSSLLRMAAVRATAALPPDQRFLMLRALIDDPILAVRMAVAEQLASVPTNQLRDQDNARLAPLFNEYESTLLGHWDMPSTRVQLATFWRNRGDRQRAGDALRSALELNPQLEAARLNLADLERASGNDTGARALLEAGLALNPSAGNIHHSLGLLEIRAGNREKAMTHLAKAAELEEEGSRHRFVYAIALHDSGNRQKAVAQLERLNTALPGNPDVLQALVNYNLELGERQRSARYRQQLQALISALR